MSAVDSDAWTCPRCAETTRGSSKARRNAQRACARRHRTPPQPSAPTPGPLVIPAAPKARRRAR